MSGHYRHVFFSFYVTSALVEPIRLSQHYVSVYQCVSKFAT